MTAAPIGIAYLDGPRLRRSLLAAADWVDASRDELNRINVFPVPDGDTGTNFAMTLRAVAAGLRQLVALKMGLITDLFQFSGQDVLDGHRPLYSLERLRKDIHMAGLKIHHEEGILLKPLPAKDMEGLAPTILEGYYQTGKELDPSLCSSLFMRVMLG